jgi:hypothetical protein
VGEFCSGGGELDFVSFNDLRSERVIYARVGDTIGIDYTQANTDAWVITDGTKGVAEANETFQFRLDAR